MDDEEPLELSESDIETASSASTFDLGSSGSSFLRTRSFSILQSERQEYEDRINSLVAENKKLKAEKQQMQSRLDGILSFFKVSTKPTRANGSGRAEMFSSELQSVALEAMSFGVAARDVHILFTVIARTLGLLINDNYRVPKESYYRQLRNKIPALLTTQAQQFISNATSITISFDGTSLHGNGVVALGAFDQDCNFAVLGIKQSSGKKAIELAAVMYSLITDYPGLQEKIQYLITDTSAAQLAANRLLVDKLNRTRTEHLVQIIICLMHSVINFDNRSYKQLSDETKEVHTSLKILFGARKTDGYRKDSLKTELEKQLAPQSSPFLTDVGSRFKVNHNNGRALIIYEDHVEQVLECEQATKPRHTRLRELAACSTTWDAIRLELGLSVVVWSAVIDQFHRTVSAINTKFGDVVLAFDVLIKEVRSILQSKDSFKTALELAKQVPFDDDSETPVCLDQLTELWNYSSLALKKRINTVTKKSFDQILQKALKDYKVISELNIPDQEVLPWTNRRIVSSNLMFYTKSL